MSCAATMRGAALLTGLLIAGCGQKGALYLPEATGEVITRPAPTPAESTPEGDPSIEPEEKSTPRTPSP
jgi:predicted small lipoprotein YifL